jgi:type I restriction enzyme M protein
VAIKKSELYSSLWASCDELRGGMDASQYKDYVLFMLFIKYVSDKYADSDDFAPPVTIPAGASFKDMIALKGRSDIGDKINTQVIAPLVNANARLARSDFPDFNDPNKLGEGDAMVKRLENLIGIFEKLDLSSNRAEHDDILGDAYEYLMRHFATESGKSKGQFYTPSEVSRVIAKVIGISPANTVAATTAYDPTCGSGSLLLKLAAEAGKHITLEGQEKDVTTAGLARMNMILHDFPTANILNGNTLAAPKFKDERDDRLLRTYDYVVANPPFSDKTWSTGLKSPDEFQRFTWGEPPRKQGDYAYLLHIIRSMKGKAKAACILPHGVLFRGNAEATIREQLVRSGYLKGIISLPANLFYGTGIPACIVVLDKENAPARRGVFMIDASQGFIKDGNKNRLREQDIHKIVDTFARQVEIARYSRMVKVEEIADAKNAFNLNLPRYIDSTEPEDLQDIDAHLNGGIPERDINAFAADWQQFPDVRAALFEPAGRSGYVRLKLPMAEVKNAIFSHSEFEAFQQRVTKLFAQWRTALTPRLMNFGQGDHPKELIRDLSETLLVAMQAAPILDPYDVYQLVMDYWAETMQDDCYLIVGDGWIEAAQPRLIVEDKNKKTKARPDFVLGKKKYQTELIPPALIIQRWFADEQTAIEKLEADLAALQQELEDLTEENGGDEGAFSSLDKINRVEINRRLKEIDEESVKEGRESLRVAEDPVPFGGNEKSESEILLTWLNLDSRSIELSRKLKAAQETLIKNVAAKYPKLTENVIQMLVVEDKWLATIDGAVNVELDRVSQTLTGRIRQLAERYATPLPRLTEEVATLAARVDEHLEKMGAVWK